MGKFRFTEEARHALFATRKLTLMKVNNGVDDADLGSSGAFQRGAILGRRCGSITGISRWLRCLGADFGRLSHHQ
jgi:hypothetical protein